MVDGLPVWANGSPTARLSPGARRSCSRGGRASSSGSRRSPTRSSARGRSCTSFRPTRSARSSTRTRPSGSATGLSARSAAEQGADADPVVLEELARLNADYEERHGFRFVVFVNRRPKAEILEVLRDRIDNPTETELETALDELVAIAGDRWVHA